MEAETLYADSDGVSIAYQVHGEGPLDLVFVPGFVSHVELFWDDPLTAGFLRRLSSFARVVIWDKRGQGLSDRTGRPRRRRTRWTIARRCWRRRTASDRRSSASPRAGRCRRSSPLP